MTDISLGISRTPLGLAIDAAMIELERGESAWALTGLHDRRGVLADIRELVRVHADEWVTIAATIKELDPQSPLVGEEWLSGPYPLLTNADALAESLAALERGRSPLAGSNITAAPGNRIRIQILPDSVTDNILLNGFTAEVWLQPGIDKVRALAAAGLGQLHPEKTAGIGVVLGAGNITSIAPLDVLYEIYAHNRVVALKLSPVMDPLLPVLEKIFAPLIERNIVRIFTGGAEVGEYLVNHDLVAHVHMTGSAATHDAIVFGAEDQGTQRKVENSPLLDKPITSELGGVSPTIVFPGKWSSADLRYQAEHVATQRLHNGGYNCVAAQILVVSSTWTQKDQFLREVREALDRAPTRAAYYPGSDGRLLSALKQFPDAQTVGRKNERVICSGLRRGEDHPIFHEEYFAPVLGIIELPFSGVEFAREAVEFANSECAGTLGVNIIAHPATIRSYGQAFDSAVANLRYGTIAVNTWTGFGYLTAKAPWGSFPGHTLADVQSGIGVVHNSLLIGHTERTVVRGPFRPAPRSVLAGEFSLSPRPPWFVTNTAAATTARKLTEYVGSPSLRKMLGIFLSSLRG